MSTSHGSISEQSRKRLQGGELILKGYDNEDIAYILDVGESSVKRWRRKLNANNNDIARPARNPFASQSIRPRLHQCNPNGRKMKFHFTIMDGSCVTENFVFRLIQLHRHFRKKVIVVRDRLSAHMDHFFPPEYCSFKSNIQPQRFQKFLSPHLAVISL